jgi:glycerol-3-phosphate acyltransferase PlsY
LFRISSVSSLIAIFSSIILSSTYDAPSEQVWFCVFLFIVILARHKENIIRLITGEEKKL